MTKNTELTSKEKAILDEKKKQRYIKKSKIFWSLPYEEKLHFWETCVEQTPKSEHLLLVPLKFFYPGTKEVDELMNYEGQKVSKDFFDNLRSPLDYLHILPNLSEENGNSEIKPFLDWLICQYKYTEESIKVTIEEEISEVPIQYKAERLEQIVKNANMTGNIGFDKFSHVSLHTKIGFNYAKFNDTKEFRNVFYAEFGTIYLKEQTGHETRLKDFLKGYQSFLEIKMGELLLEENPRISNEEIPIVQCELQTAGKKYAVFYELGIIDFLEDSKLKPSQIHVLLERVCGASRRTYEKLSRDIYKTQRDKICKGDYPVPNNDNRADIDEVYNEMKHNVSPSRKLPVVPRN